MKEIKPKSNKFTIIDMERSYSSEEALEEINKFGKPVTEEYLQKLMEENPDDFEKNKWYMAFGSVSVFALGYRRVPHLCLRSDGSVNRDWLYWDDDWNADYCLVLICGENFDPLSTRIARIEKYLSETFNNFQV